MIPFTYPGFHKYSQTSHGDKIHQDSEQLFVVFRNYYGANSQRGG